MQVKLELHLLNSVERESFSGGEAPLNNILSL